MSKNALRSVVGGLAVLVLFGSACGLEARGVLSKVSVGTFAHTQPVSLEPGTKISLHGASAEDAVDAFGDETFAVAQGVSVTWTNLDTVTHVLVSDDQLFEKQTLAPAATFTRVMNELGTHNFHVEGSPELAGSIVVTKHSDESEEGEEGQEQQKEPQPEQSPDPQESQPPQQQQQPQPSPSPTVSPSPGPSVSPSPDPSPSATPSPSPSPTASQTVSAF